MWQSTFHEEFCPPFLYQSLVLRNAKFHVSCHLCAFSRNSFLFLHLSPCIPEDTHHPLSENTQLSSLNVSSLLELVLTPHLKDSRFYFTLGIPSYSLNKPSSITQSSLSPTSKQEGERKTKGSIELLRISGGSRSYFHLDRIPPVSWEVLSSETPKGRESLWSWDFLKGGELHNRRDVF